MPSEKITIDGRPLTLVKSLVNLAFGRYKIFGVRPRAILELLDPTDTVFVHRKKISNPENPRASLYVYDDAIPRINGDDLARVARTPSTTAIKRKRGPKEICAPPKRLATDDEREVGNETAESNESKESAKSNESNDAAENNKSHELLQVKLLHQQDKMDMYRMFFDEKLAIHNRFHGQELSQQEANHIAVAALETANAKIKADAERDLIAKEARLKEETARVSAEAEKKLNILKIQLIEEIARSEADKSKLITNQEKEKLAFEHLLTLSKGEMETKDSIHEMQTIYAANLAQTALAKAHADREAKIAIAAAHLSTAEAKHATELAKLQITLEANVNITAAKLTEARAKLDAAKERTSFLEALWHLREKEKMRRERPT